VHRAYLHARHAIDAVFRVNDHLVVHFVKARDRAHLYAIGELTSVTLLGHNMGHGIFWVENYVKTAVTSNERRVSSQIPAFIDC
jgi:hypothetical protein